MPTPPARRPSRAPARHTRTPATTDAGTTTGPSPVQVRLMGDDTAVRQLVAALQAAAHCGPATYRSMRDSDGTRAYLDVVVPAQPADRPGR